MYNKCSSKYDTGVTHVIFVVSEVRMNKWLGLALAVLCLLLIGCVVSAIFVLRYNSEDISEVDRFFENSLPPVASLVDLLSSLLFVSILFKWSIPKTHIDMIRYCCGWNNSGYDGRNFGLSSC